MSRRNLLPICVVIVVASISLVAGLVWRYYSEPAEASIQDIDDLRIYQNQWKSLNGPAVGVDDWTGKVLLLNFWASWCPPCIEEMPLLDQFNENHGGDRLQIVGVVMDSEEPARQFLIDNGIRFPSVISEPQITDQMMTLLGNSDRILPFSVAFSNSGGRVFKKAGPLTEEDLLKLIN